MHVLAIYFDSASCYNMCVYERAMCGGMEIEFCSLRLYFIFFFFTLTIYRTASASNNTQFRIDPQSIDDRGRVAWLCRE